MINYYKILTFQMKYFQIEKNMVGFLHEKNIKCVVNIYKHMIIQFQNRKKCIMDLELANFSKV